MSRRGLLPYRPHPAESEGAHGTIRVLVHPHIDEANPYLRLFARSLEHEGVRSEPFSWQRLLRRPFDILHVHWPELAVGPRANWKAVIRTVLLVLCVQTARWRGAAIVWTVHNLHSHEQWHPRLERILMRWWTHQVDGALTLSNWARDHAISRYPALRHVPFRTIPHGHFPSVPSGDRLGARRRLQIPASARVALHFGHLRPYKGTDDLIQCFVDSSLDMLLYVVGRARPESYATTLRRLADEDSRIRLRVEQVPDSELEALLAACDVVILPYRHATHSGSVLLALGAERLTITTDTGAMRELQSQVGSEWLTILEPSLDAAKLEAAVRSALAGDPQRSPDVEGQGWDYIAAIARTLYDEALAGSRRRM